MTVVGMENESAITVTTPTGGWVRYASRRHADAYPNGYDPRWDSFTVRSRQWGGPGVAGGELQFSYPADGTPTTTIDGASGVSYHATYTFSPSAFWTVPLVSLSVGIGAVHQETVYSWVPGETLGSPCIWSLYPNVPLNPVSALLPSTAWATREGRTYTRTYGYDTVRFNNFGQPSTVSESGEFTHTTTLAYQGFSGPTYLGDRPVSATVDGVAGSLVYDPDTGFVTSRTAAGDVTTNFTPDAYGNVHVQVVGGTQQTTFDHLWGVVNTITAPQSTVTLAVNPDGSVATASENGHTTSYGYDGAGRLTSVQPPVGYATTTTYASDARSITTTRGTASTTVCLDGFGRTAFTFDSTGARADVEYDAMGRVIRQTLPYTTSPAPTSCSSAPASAPPSVQLAYDALGRVTTRTNADGTYVTYAYDSTPENSPIQGLRTTITEHPGGTTPDRTTAQILQASGSPSNSRLASVTNADGKITSYVYDGSGSLTQVLAPNQLAKSWSYDTQTGRLMSETQPESGTVLYRYDALGRLSTRNDPAVGVTTYGYDASNRITSVATEPPPEQDPTPARAYNTAFEYDPSGNRSSATNGYVTTRYEYDAGNRLKNRIDEIAGHRFETSFDYDDANNRMVLTYPSGNRVTYAYDSTNRLARVYDDDRGLEFARDFTYRPSGALASYTSGNGIVNAVDYNANTEQPTHIGSSDGVLDLTYAYDGAGNVTGIADTRAGKSATYTYDVLNRLLTATGPWGELAYDYDAIGNRKSSTLVDTMTPPTTTRTVYGYSPTTNRLSSATTGEQRYEEFHHDDNGRLTQDGAVQAYTYTPANLLETAETWAGALTTYRYDADGQRVLKVAGSETSRAYVVNELSEFSTDGGPIHWTVDYVYAGSRLLAAVRPAAGTLRTLTVTKEGTGTGRVSARDGGLDCGADCTARYLDGTTVVLTATADASSAFTGWSGACSGSASSATVTVDAAMTCTATFTLSAPSTYLLTIGKTGDGSDDSLVTSSPSGISCGASCSASFAAGASVELTVNPADGFELVGWQGEGCTTGTVTMSGARTCTAVFQVLPSSCDPDGSLQAECRASGGGWWDEASCSCQSNWEDPLVLSLAGSPIHLTTRQGGVGFDVDGDGGRESLAWTRAGSSAAFLVVDLDQDGVITTGAELFGVPAAAPRRQKPLAGENSFTLLAAYDAPANGENGDGRIGAADAVFSRLRLWIDANHDGVSQPEELVPLAAAGVGSIELSYRLAGRRDGHGNFYRYRGIVHMASGRNVPIWDVFLATGPGAESAAEPADEGIPLDDDALPVDTTGMETAGPGPAGDSVSTFASAEPDLTPTPLQVVEYYHLDAFALRHGAGQRPGRRLRATLSERAKYASRMGRVGAGGDRRGGTGPQAPRLPPVRGGTLIANPADGPEALHGAGAGLRNWHRLLPRSATAGGSGAVYGARPDDGPGVDRPDAGRDERVRICRGQSAGVR